MPKQSRPSDELIIDGAKYTIKTYLWRNYPKSGVDWYLARCFDADNKIMAQGGSDIGY